MYLSYCTDDGSCIAAETFVYQTFIYGHSNFIGYNYLFGASYCKSYLADHSATGCLIREICSPHTIIPNFSHDELDATVSFTTT